MVHRFTLHKACILLAVALCVATATLVLCISSAGAAITIKPYAQLRPGPAVAFSSRAIDTSRPVEFFQCSPCHASLATVNVPGLKFSHGAHLLVACSICHRRMPHKDGVTAKVTMATCFACHGIEHGPKGELATAACRRCHTKSFTLRPLYHSKNWAEKPHATASTTPALLNDCMMCHNATKECNPCHIKLQVKTPSLPNVYHSVIEKTPKEPSIKVYPEAGSTISQCQYCHNNLDASVSPGVIFKHQPHLSRNYSCSACHAKFPHNQTGTILPKMIDCYRCHGVQHNGQGSVASENCYKCHPKDFVLIPRNHTKVFIMRSHGSQAKVEPEYCSMCHKEAFCVPCHRGTSKSPNAPAKAVVPPDHLKASWMGAHGAPYLRGDGLCGVCHDGPSCQRCHKTVMPHPADFVANHKPAPGVTNADCRICHQDRNSCQDCHHGGVKNAQLLAKNCVRCHPEMKQKPAVDIKNKGFAEHAVHFNVAKKNGSPYRCYECHFSFGKTPVTGSKTTPSVDATGRLQQGHDLRLCYTCHGALNPLNEQIAPYGGSDLCLRCHSNLNL